MLRYLMRALIMVWNASPKYVTSISLISVIQGLLPVVQLYVGKLLFDLVSNVLQGVATTNPLASLLFILFIEAAIGLTGIGLYRIYNYAETLLGEQLSNDIQHKILLKASQRDLSSFENSAFYDQMRNAFQEATSRPVQIVSQISNIIQSSIAVISFATVLVNFSPWIVLILLATAVPSFVIQTRYGSLNYWMLRSRIPDLRKQEYFSYILQTDWLIKELKLFNLEGYFIERFATFFNRFFFETSRLQKQQMFAEVGGSLISSLGTVGAMIFIVFAVVRRNITIGDFTLYGGAISQFQKRVEDILGGASELYSHALFISNLFEFLDLPISGLDKGKTWTEPIVSIEFRNVSFCYPNTDKLILKEINFTIHRGQTLSIVGPNGAGKTTLIKLLCALYQPTQGQILINGQDIKHYSQRSVQRQISATFQDFGRYELTLQENVELGYVDGRGDEQRLHKAILMAGVKDDSENLPKGYATQLGRWFDEGQQLSGGQWQKVALARTYFRNASVVILDEPTSALDANSEFEVYQNVRQHHHHKITILISHRLGTARLADQIIVLENNRITEQGSHEALLTNGGYYKDHFNLQASGYR